MIYLQQNNLIENVVQCSIYILYLIILIFILLLQLTVLYLQQFNLIPIFNLVLAFDEKYPITPATIMYTCHNYIVSSLFFVLHRSHQKLVLREKISKFKFQIVNMQPRRIKKLPTICISDENIITHTPDFIITKVDSKRFLIQLA
jgi:hypothetical protein